MARALAALLALAVLVAPTLSLASPGCEAVNSGVLSGTATFSGAGAPTDTNSANVETVNTTAFASDRATALAFNAGDTVHFSLTLSANMYGYLRYNTSVTNYNPSFKNPTSGSYAQVMPSGVGKVYIFSGRTSTGDDGSITAAASCAPAQPVVASLGTTTGPTAGGTSVVIHGTSFLGTTTVQFDNIAAVFTVVDDTTINATTPGGTGPAHVRVTNATGPSAPSAGDQFTYSDAPILGLTISHTGIATQGQPFSFTARVGATAAATTGAVTIDIPLPAGLTVDTVATSINFNCSASTSTHVICSYSPSIADGGNTGDITVSTAVAANSPVSLTISGTASGGGAASSASGSDTVTVNQVASHFAVSGPASTVAGTSFTTLSIQALDAANAVVTGYGGTVAFTSTDPMAVLPANTTLFNGAGTFSATLSTPGSQTITARDAVSASITGTSAAITVIGHPTVTSISPPSGPGSGGTTVTITGANLNGATAVSFGATPASGMTVVNDTTITATAPAGSGTVDVTVTTSGGTSATSAADHYVYAPLPVVTSISPASGSTLGGTVVTVTGTGFTGATAVVFGATTASTFTVNSDTQITVTSPAVSPSIADVRVTTLGGTSATSAADQFTFNKADQTISFTSTAPSGAMLGGTTYTPAASATSGGTVVFSIDAAASSVCAISGGVVSFTGVGTCTINANQGGSSVYNSAPQAQQSFAVGKGNQTITFTSTAPSPGLINGATYTPTATATSGGTVVITVDPSSAAVCSMSGGVVHFNAGGTCTLNANQAGDGSYNAAPQAQQVITVSQPTTVPTLAQWAMILLAGLLAAMGVGVGTRRRA